MSGRTNLKREELCPGTLPGVSGLSQSVFCDLRSVLTFLSLCAPVLGSPSLWAVYGASVISFPWVLFAACPFWREGSQHFSVLGRSLPAVFLPVPLFLP